MGVGKCHGSLTDGTDNHHKITLIATLSILLEIAPTCPFPSETFTHVIKLDCLECVHIMLLSL